MPSIANEAKIGFVPDNFYFLLEIFLFYDIKFQTPQSYPIFAEYYFENSFMKIRRIAEKHDLPDIEHEELGIPPLEEEVHEEPSSLFQKSLLLAGTIFAVLLLGYGLLYFLAPPDIYANTLSFFSIFSTGRFWTYALVGLGAQMIDGALGMAYGISSTTFLLSTGVGPAAASASVHIAEMFTSGVSGFSHLKLGNVNKKLFRTLLIPGVIGGVMGAFISTSIDGGVLKPYISGYLMIMGIVVIRKALKKNIKKKKTKGLGPLALFGGFVDAVGGGGWGPVVTTTLVGSGRDPRYTIGSVNLAEFFVAIGTALAFTLFMGMQEWSEIGHLWQIIAGLIFGGLFAAPFAAYICRRVKAKHLMLFVGILIILLSLRTLLKSIFGISLF